MPPERDNLPAWLAWAALAGVCLVAGVLLTGMLLAMLGIRHEAAGIPLALIAAGGLLWLARPVARGSADRGALAAGAGAVALAVASAAVNAHFSAQHVIADRDPGIYLWFGRWLTDHTSLFLDNPRQFFPTVEHGVLAQCPVTCRNAPGDRLYVQFLHGLPVTLGTAGWLGGAGLIVKTNAILGGLSLLTFYAFATRLLRPLFALAATTALALSFPQVYFSRDTYSEILAQLLLFGGLWLLWEARSRRLPRVGLAAGLALGLTCAVRIDSFLYAIPLIAWAIGELVLAAPRDRRLRTTVISAMAGATVGGAIGAVDLHVFSFGYLRHQRHEVNLLEAGIAATVVLGGLVLLLRDPLLRAARPLALRIRPAAAVVLPAAIVLAGLLLWIVRPEVQHLTGQFDRELAKLQHMNHIAVEPTRNYGEAAMRWIGWYLGPVGVLAGIAGLALAAREIVLGRRPLLVPLVGIVAVAGGLYLISPHIFPDQIWAMRRYVPAVIPGFLVLGAWAAQQIPWRPAALAVAAGIVVLPAVILVPVFSVHEQAGGLAAMDRICANLPPRAAVWTIPGPQETRLIQPVHAFCEVPVAQSPPDAPRSVIDLAVRTAAAKGRKLVLISTRRYKLQRVLNTTAPFPPNVTYRFERLEQTLTRRPVHRLKQQLHFYLVSP